MPPPKIGWEPARLSNAGKGHPRSPTVVGYPVNEISTYDATPGSVYRQRPDRGCASQVLSLPTVR